MITTPDYEEALAYALNRLRHELSPELIYHSFWHTSEDVMPTASRLARLLHIPEEDQHLLQVAAAYHDIGYVVTHEAHEQASIEIMKQSLPQFGFTSTDIERLSGLIAATRLPQSPQNLLEEILADADLDVLGREDFWVRSNHLRQELTILGRKTTQRQWYQTQLKFLEDHYYFTSQAKALRQAAKQTHIHVLKELLHNSDQSSI